MPAAGLPDQQSAPTLDSLRVSPLAGRVVASTSLALHLTSNAVVLMPQPEASKRMLRLPASEEVLQRSRRLSGYRSQVSGMSAKESKLLD